MFRVSVVGTAIQVTCIVPEWSLTVPYWSDGDAAATIAGRLHAIAAIVQAVTGLEAYDPQLDVGVTTDEWTAQHAATVFDGVAEGMGKLGARSD